MVSAYDRIERIICGRCGVEMIIDKEDVVSRTYKCRYENECSNSVIIHMCEE